MRIALPAKLMVALLAIGLLAGAVPAEANPFAKIFHSIKHPRNHRAEHRKKRADKATPSPTPEFSGVRSVAAPQNPVAPARPVASRSVAQTFPKRKSGEKLLAGVVVPDKPGFLRSPYTENQAVIDVRGFPSGTEVKDPTTGRIFLTP